MAKKIDAVTVEIIGNLLLSVAEEVGVAIVKSSYSTNIKERRDISTAVFDPDGNLIAQAEYVSMHLGSLISTITEIYKKFPREEIRPGDMFVGNDPYQGGGTHLSDITIAVPVFGGGRLIGWIANLGHHSDIGGKVPGSIPGDAVSIFEEGLRIPLIKICENDKADSRIVEFIMDNSRSPNERYGDIQAQIAGNRVGRRRLEEAYKRWGDTLVECMYALEEYTERRLRAGIAKLKDGEYYFEDFMDTAGVFSKEPAKIAVRVKKQGDSMSFDFAGTNPQVDSPINLTYNGLMATVFYCMKTLIDPDVPSNVGISRTFDVKVEPGLLINCLYPSPVGERIDTAQRVVDVIFGALAPIVGNRAMACCNSSCTSAIFGGYDRGDTEKKRYLIYMETIGGGSGAHPDMDGLSGVHVHMTNTSNLPVEALEMEFPLLMVEKYELCTSSGGAGKYRGGLGMERRFKIFSDCVCTALADRQIFPPWGLGGGLSGACGAYLLTRAGRQEPEKLDSKVTNLHLHEGDRLSIITPGSGGYGNGFTRDVDAVLVDVIEAKITPDEAKGYYGVIVEKDGDRGYRVDAAGTKAAREAG